MKAKLEAIREVLNQDIEPTSKVLVKEAFNLIDELLAELDSQELVNRVTVVIAEMATGTSRKNFFKEKAQAAINVIKG